MLLPPKQPFQLRPRPPLPARPRLEHKVPRPGDASIQAGAQAAGRPGSPPNLCLLSAPPGAPQGFPELEGPLSKGITAPECDRLGEVDSGPRKQRLLHSGQCGVTATSLWDPKLWERRFSRNRFPQVACPAFLNRTYWYLLGDLQDELNLTCIPVPRCLPSCPWTQRSHCLQRGGRN